MFENRKKKRAHFKRIKIKAKWTAFFLKHNGCTFVTLWDGDREREREKKQRIRRIATSLASSWISRRNIEYNAKKDIALHSLSNWNFCTNTKLLRTQSRTSPKSKTKHSKQKPGEFRFAFHLPQSAFFTSFSFAIWRCFVDLVLCVRALLCACIYIFIELVHVNEMGDGSN